MCEVIIRIGNCRLPGFVGNVHWISFRAQVSAAAELGQGDHLSLKANAYTLAVLNAREVF